MNKASWCQDLYSVITHTQYIRIRSLFQCFNFFNLFRCWKLKLTQPRSQWRRVPSPPFPLFLTSTASRSKEADIVLVGGSKKLEYEEKFDQMIGSTIVQKFNVALETWSGEADLPAPLFQVRTETNLLIKIKLELTILFKGVFCIHK